MTVVLGLDVGDARIGLARAEAGSALAFGRGWIDRTSFEADLAELRRIAMEEEADLLVIGLPRRSDGADSEQTRSVRRFADRLSEAGLEVTLEDERFTTRIAGRQLATGPRSRGKRQVKGLLDEAAAVLILETWLQRNSGAA